MKNLTNAIYNEIAQRYNKQISEIQTEEGLNKVMQFHGKQYNGNERVKMDKFLRLKWDREIAETGKKIGAVKEAKDFSDELIITLEWKRSRMWGANPRAYTNYDFEGESIGGCGYCKTSTASAQALNSHLPLMKLLYKKKEAHLRKNKSPKDKLSNSSHTILGYGAGYGILPHFEGGVGVSCHQRIVEGLGLKWRDVSSTEWTNVYMISK